jgi:hypothetical protein
MPPVYGCAQRWLMLLLLWTQPAMHQQLLRPTQQQRQYGHARSTLLLMRLVLVLVVAPAAVLLLQPLMGDHTHWPSQTVYDSGPALCPASPAAAEDPAGDAAAAAAPRAAAAAAAVATYGHPLSALLPMRLVLVLGCEVNDPKPQVGCSD